MTKFICKNCNYRFESQFEQKDRACSYCGKKEVVKEPSAEEILEGV